MQNTKQEFYTKMDALTIETMHKCLWLQGCKRFEATRELNRLSRGYFGIPAYQVMGKENVEILFKLIMGRDFETLTKGGGRNGTKNFSAA